LNIAGKFDEHPTKGHFNHPQITSAAGVTHLRNQTIHIITRAWQPVQFDPGQRLHQRRAPCPKFIAVTGPQRLVIMGPVIGGHLIIRRCSLGDCLFEGCDLCLRRIAHKYKGQASNCNRTAKSAENWSVVRKCHAVRSLNWGKWSN